MTWLRDMKKLSSAWVSHGASRLPGWGIRDEVENAEMNRRESKSVAWALNCLLVELLPCKKL